MNEGEFSVFGEKVLKMLRSRREKFCFLALAGTER